MNSKTIHLGALKPQAVKLRLEGKTYTEIQTELGFISKSTLSGWLKNIELTPSQNLRIKDMMTKNGLVGRQMGAWSNHQKRLDRLASIRDSATTEYALLLEKQTFLAGLILYLAEGSKKTESFQFMNSDPYLIRIMINWIVEIGGIDFTKLRFRLYIHEIYAHENCELFWVNALNARPEQFLRTIFKPTGRVYKKNPSYKGCLRIENPGNELYWRTMTWRDCLYGSMG